MFIVLLPPLKNLKILNHLLRLFLRIKTKSVRKLIDKTEVNAG